MVQFFLHPGAYGIKTSGPKDNYFTMEEHKRDGVIPRYVAKPATTVRFVPTRTRSFLKRFLIACIVRWTDIDVSGIDERHNTVVTVSCCI
jgi:hypothetical protein